MKNAIYILIGICVLFVSCGKDRTNEYEERTSRDHWIFEVMQEEYLWGDVLTEVAWKDYFAQPQDFLSKLTQQAPVKDTWSWCEIDTLPQDYHERGYFNHLSSYGLDLFVMTDPTGETSRQFARIMTVYANSPASRCGLQRGDFISTVDGTKINTSVVKNLVNGKRRTLIVERLIQNESEGTLEWGEAQTIELDASEFVDDIAYPISKVFSTESGKIGYLMCNRLVDDNLDATMASFSGTEYDGFVLDMRLCNDGMLDSACRLASYFVDENQRGQLFAKTIYSEKKQALNASILFDEEAIIHHLKTNYVYVITSSYTKGAAEWLIRGLQKALGDEYVVIVGMTTAGQIVMTSEIPSDFYVTLHPAVAYVADADEDYNYADGLNVDIELDERSALYLYPYGNEKELLLNTILNHE